MQRKFFLIFGIIFLGSLSQMVGAVGARPTAIDYPFEKKVILPKMANAAEIRIDLGQELLGKINQRFSNFSIFDNDNEELDFTLFYTDVHHVKNPVVIETSSRRADNLQNLVDDNVLTPFVFDERTDGADDSWMLIDLGEIVPISRVEIFLPDGKTLKDIQLAAGVDKNNLSTILTKRPFDWRLDLLSEPAQFLKISLWGVNVKVDDVRIRTGRTASVYFQATPGKPTFARYGGPEVDSLRFKQRISSDKKTSTIADVGPEKWNPLFAEDFDDDGYKNSDDNCPFRSNHSQRDSDGDRVGNECDNASNVKNFNQSDLDFDHVGDLVDNCRLIYNPDQADRDGDNWGDACDNAHAKESVEITPKHIKIIAGAAVLLLVGFGVFTVVKISKKKS